MRQGKLIATALFLGMVFSLPTVVRSQGGPPPGRGPGSSLADRVAELEAQVAALEEKTQFQRVDLNAINGLAGPQVIFEGANVHIQSGLGFTDDDVTGLGNLVVGYNEEPFDLTAGDRDGAHNLVVGLEHKYQRFGGFVAGRHNLISGKSASVSGGVDNRASGRFSSVSGGRDNEASSFGSSVSGGLNNTASGFFSSVTGGSLNTASGPQSSVSGGVQNTASGARSSVSGGGGDEASGRHSSVSGGFRNTASGVQSRVSGGFLNTASGRHSSVSGGKNRSVSGLDDWRAGGLFEDF